MYDIIDINPRINERHPDINESDVKIAWKNAPIIIERSGGSLPSAVLVAVGFDARSRLIEMVGAVNRDGVVHIFHAMTPPSKRTLRELGLSR